MTHKKITSMFLLFLLFVILNIQTISANNSSEDLIKITPYNIELSPGEVFQAEILLEDPASELKKQDIKLYSSTNTQQHIAPFLKELSKDYYFLYFELPFPLENGNYTLKLENLNFIINGVLTELEAESKILISTIEPSVSVTPGFFLLEQKIGQIFLTTESKDIATEVSFQTPDFISHPYTTNQPLNPNTPRKFTFDYDISQIKDYKTQNIILNYGSKIFKIPLFILTQDPSEGPLESPIEFQVDGDLLKKQVESTQTLEGSLFMKNKLNQTLQNMEIRLTGNLPYILQIEPNSLSEILPLEDFSVFMTINKDKSPTEKSYNGQLIIKNSEYSSALDISVEILETQQPKNYTVIEYNKTTQDLEETTQEENVSDQVYDVIPWDLELSEETPEETKGSVKIFTLFVIFLLAVAIIIFFLSGKKTVKKKKFSELVQEAQKK